MGYPRIETVVHVDGTCGENVVTGSGYGEIINAPKFDN